MRLSLVCLFKKSVNGHIFRGKDRLVKRVSKQAMDTLRNEYDRQEKVMQLLRYPFLTPVRMIYKCILCLSCRIQFPALYIFIYICIVAIECILYNA